MGDQGWTDNTEIEIDDEDIHICWKFGINGGLASRTKDRCHNDNPYSNDDNLEDER